MNPTSIVQEVWIPAGAVEICAELHVPEDACGLVLFVPSGGSSRFGARNRRIAEFLDDAGFATMMVDLLSPDEERIDARTAEFRFDLPLQASRVRAAIDWAALHPLVGALPLGCFAAGTGAAAALMAAADRPATVLAVVSRGGRPDLVGSDVLARVEAPTLLIVGGHDEPVLEMNQWALRQMHADARLEIVPRATHVFDERGALDRVAWLAGRWFGGHLAGVADAPMRATA